MPLGLFSNVLIPTLIREKSPAVWKKNTLTLMEMYHVLRLFQSILAYTRRWWVVVGKKERKQSVRQIPPTNAQKVRHSHAPLITISGAVLLTSIPCSGVGVRFFQDF